MARYRLLIVIVSRAEISWAGCPLFSRSLSAFAFGTLRARLGPRVTEKIE